ncbi:hypothetical protein FIBSPDRAFT_926768 [Athelia psychrophila]|uniref:Uncharacterized protein n=1 Tax=Athelia psychrophila TaxID=1759441 RepID=A0A166SWU8_9AGAM|nr:hypothetical protein FIBSPDRAFT_926768 [Fibularhizoctonia sp. CBS 109695]
MSSYTDPPPPSYQPAPLSTTQPENPWHEEDETEPLIPGRQKKVAWYRTSHIKCITIASAILFVVMVSCMVLSATHQNQQLMEWERDLTSKKALEKIRELEWGRQMEQKRAEQLLREKEWDRQMEEGREEEHCRELEWERQMEQTRAQEYLREKEWDHQMEERHEEERGRELEWDGHMEEKRAEQLLREKEWDHQMEERHEEEHGRELEWDRQMRQARAQEQLQKKKWEHHMVEKREEELRREKKWELAMNTSREQWEYHLREQKAREQEREQAWEHQMEEKHDEELIREGEWDVSQERRERLGLYWDQPAPGRCSAHGVRDHHAQLLNATPYRYNWLQPCEDMPIFIHGSMRTASRCERIGNEIWGHWSVKDESVCTPFFEDWRDHGCIAPGSQLRLASARLDYIPSGENGLELCDSTPHKFWDKYFPHPTTCAESHGAIWGYWESEDVTYITCGPPSCDERCGFLPTPDFQQGYTTNTFLAAREECEINQELGVE